MTISQQIFHSSQEALAIAVRDWILNSGQLVKSDVMRIGNIIELVRPLQKKHGELIELTEREFASHGLNFNPMFDKEGYLSVVELNYEMRLCSLFGKLWLIMSEEELIPPGLLSSRKEKWD